MTSVPYLYIPLIAMFCYIFILTSLLAAKKNALINSYILFIIGFMMWTGGSLFMRLQLAPGVMFWYDVSILSLFSIALFIYLFVYSYAKAKGWVLTAVWTVGTIVIDVLTYFEVFLKHPQVETLADGRTIFTYQMEWQIAIPTVFFLLIVISIVRLLVKMMREKSGNTLGVKMIIVGCIVVLVGNVVSIIPGNIFPWDTLSGIVNALCLFYALYTKRVFKLTLLISKNALLLISVLLVGVPCFFVVRPLDAYLTKLYPAFSDYVVILISALMMLMIGIVFFVLRRVFDRLFGKEEQAQSRAIERFSFVAAQTLNTADIMKELGEVIRANIPVEKVFICLKKDNAFVGQYASNPLDSTSFELSADNPCIAYLKHDEAGMILADFKNNTLYRSMWEEEKRLLTDLNIACMFALKSEDSIVGLIMLTDKVKKSSFHYNDMYFLGAVSSIASIAVKNAELYERVYHESRVDSLTGLYNYKSFCEQIEEQFQLAKDGSLALLFLDIDDFKLYNQLYGNDEGDRMLRQITEIISYCVRSKGIAFRYGGKVFACLFPNGDARSVLLTAQEIRRRIHLINEDPKRQLFKRITLSGGICVYPYMAANVRELIDNADIAVYNAKNNGKDNITVYSTEAADRSDSAAAGSFFANRFTAQSDSTTYAAYESTIYALTAAIDAKDHYTFSHSQNVAKYSTQLAEAIGMNKEHIRILYEAALLHDIGKISIPEHILCKNGPLTGEEYEIIKTHVNNSIEMIRHLPSMDYVIPAAVSHHERWDGRGYPRGIKGEDIPIAGRCLAIADAFDAMTSNRSYRAAMSTAYAAEQILANAGTQFDPNLAKIFVELVRSGQLRVETGEACLKK
ncbi:MAG: hypothetical protein DBY36_06715 [Clostridiales bacterium]|nr:MAG: hypothetical protein DBY36_06715 [Clostridiales bacterium]